MGKVSKKYKVDYFGNTQKIESNTPLNYFLNAMGVINSDGIIIWNDLIHKSVSVMITDNKYGSYVQSIKPYECAKTRVRLLEDEEDNEDDYYEADKDEDEDEDEEEDEDEDDYYEADEDEDEDEDEDGGEDDDE